MITIRKISFGLLILSSCMLCIAAYLKGGMPAFLITGGIMAILSSFACFISSIGDNNNHQGDHQ